MWILLMIILVIAILVIIVELVVLDYLKGKAYVKSIEDKIHKIVDETKEVTPEEFFEIRNPKMGGNIASHYNFPGVYVLYNKTKNMYYVGQGQRVFDRVNSHFTGKGNGDVYADYKYGDEFTIKMISLNNTGYYSLNELERDTIATYDAYASGYNKTRGNR